MKAFLVIAGVGIVLAGANYGALRLAPEDGDARGTPRASTETAQAAQRPARARAAARRKAEAAAAFERRATRICRSIDAEAKKLGTPSTPRELEVFLLAVRPLMHRADRSLERLTPPARKRRLFAALVRRFPDDERLLDDLLAAVQRRDGSAIRRLIAKNEEQSRSERRLFRALGLPACAAIG